MDMLPFGQYRKRHIHRLSRCGKAGHALVSHSLRHVRFHAAEHGIIGYIIQQNACRKIEGLPFEGRRFHGYFRGLLQGLTPL